MKKGVLYKVRVILKKFLKNCTCTHFHLTCQGKIHVQMWVMKADLSSELSGWSSLGLVITNCIRKLFLSRVAASRIQIVSEWPPVGGKFPPVLFMLHPTGGHLGTICMRLACQTAEKQFTSGRQSYAFAFARAGSGVGVGFVSLRIRIRTKMSWIHNTDWIKKWRCH